MAEDSGLDPLRAAFYMEQHLGHRTFYQNLRHFIDQRADVTASWIEISYQSEQPPWLRTPLLNGRVQGALRGRSEARSAARRLQRHDVRFFNTQVPALLGGRRVRTSPYVLCTDVTPAQYDRMAEGYGHVADGQGPGARAKRLLNIHVFRGAARNVTWSTWVRESLVDEYGVDPSTVAVIPPGVDLSLWTPRVHAETTPVRILFVGGDLYRKGGQPLLEAFAALPSGTAELVLVTRTSIDGGENIRVENGLVPNSPALISLFQSSDVFVMPSAAETFGIAAVEATAAGLPVVATDVGGLSDIVVDGETGFLVAARDVDALADRLRTLVDDARLRQRMGQAARRRAETHFDGATNARRTVAILHEAAASS